MAGHNVYSQMGLALANGANTIPDPGDGGTLVLNPNLAFQICVCSSSGSDTRVIPEPTDFAIGSRLLVIGDDVSTSGTDIDFETADSVQFTTTATEDVITIDADGDSFELMVVSAAGVKQWRQVYSDGGALS